MLAFERKQARVKAKLEGARNGQGKALDMALAQSEKQFGRGSVIRLGEKPRFDCESDSPSSIALDMALGVGGIRAEGSPRFTDRNRPSKTTIAYHIVAEGSEDGRSGRVRGCGHSVDAAYAAALGVDVDALLVSQPDTGEGAGDNGRAHQKRRRGCGGAGLGGGPGAESRARGRNGRLAWDCRPGLCPRLSGNSAVRYRRSNTAVVFINQIREKIGVMFGNPETTPGGARSGFWSRPAAGGQTD